jgi:pimeloyl-ACP methyl ester carboxylesterase
MENLAKMRKPDPTQAVEFASGDGLHLSGSRLSLPGPQVLLAHGFGQTRHSWAGTQERLGDAGFGSLAWDMRGHGESQSNPADHSYSVSDFIGDHRAAAGLVGGRPVLVGASMGGLTGLMTQAAQPVFSALVLVDVTPRWEAAGMQRIHDFMTAHPDGFESYDHAARVIHDYLPHRRARKSDAQLAKLLRSDDRGRLRWHWDPRLLSEFVANSQHLQEAIAEEARKIEVPVLLISGGRSDLVSDDTVAHFIERVPHATHVRLPEATHMLAGDDNDAFTDAVLAFLRAQFDRPAPGVSR